MKSFYQLNEAQQERVVALLMWTLADSPAYTSDETLQRAARNTAEKAWYPAETDIICPGIDRP